MQLERRPSRRYITRHSAQRKIAIHTQVMENRREFFGQWHSTCFFKIEVSRRASSGLSTFNGTRTSGERVQRSMRTIARSQERKFTMAEDKIIGIDLGTTNSVVAVIEGNEPKVIAKPGRPSHHTVRRRVHRQGRPPRRRSGETASRHQFAPHHYSIKRFMGRRHNEVESEEKIVPYKVVGGSNELVKVDIDGKTYTPPEISAMILRKLKEAARRTWVTPYAKQLSQCRRTSTTPQTPSDDRRRPNRRLRHEWEIEGKDGKKTKQRMRIINEPTAASLAYGLDKKKNEKIAVFDLRRRHLRHLHPRCRRWRLRSQSHQRRHPPRRR